MNDGSCPFGKMLEIGRLFAAPAPAYEELIELFHKQKSRPLKERAGIGVGSRGLLSYCDLYRADGLQQAADDLIWISLGVRTAIFEVTLVAIANEVYRQAD